MCLLTLLRGPLPWVLVGLTPPQIFCSSVTSSECPLSTYLRQSWCHQHSASHPLTAPSGFLHGLHGGAVAHSLPVSLPWNVSSLEAENLVAPCCLQGTRRAWKASPSDGCVWNALTWLKGPHALAATRLPCTESVCYFYYLTSSHLSGKSTSNACKESAFLSLCPHGLR